jgi:cytochrome P450
LREIGSEYFIVALDGERHRHMRNFMRPAYGREAIKRYVPEIAKATQRTIERWQCGQQVDMVQTFRRLIVEQTALVMTHRNADSEFASISRFFRTAVGGIFGSIAPQALEDPEYVSAKRRVFALAHEMVAEHRAHRAGDEPDYIDLLLEATDDNGQPLDERALLAAAMVPFFVGIDTVAHTLSHLLLTLLNRPDLMDALTIEVDQALGPHAVDLASLRHMPALHRVAMETMRMYPAAPFTVRWIQEGFEFEGHKLEAGRPVMIAGPVTHFLPELFPHPLSFDPGRFADPRNEHRQPGAFVPFSTGPHACIGAQMGEVQIMITIAILLRMVRLELASPQEALQSPAASDWRQGADYTIRVVDTRALPAM